MKPGGNRVRSYLEILAPDSTPNRNEQLIPFFYRRGWTILEFNDPVLLTSDEPLAAGNAPRV